MEPHPLQFRTELLADGWTDRELRRMRRSGALTDIRRGSYAVPDDKRLAWPEGRHALLVEATLPRLAPGVDQPRVRSGAARRAGLERPDATRARHP